MPFDSAEAQVLNKKIAEEIYFYALSTSVELAKLNGPHENFSQTRAAKGELQFDFWGVTPTDTKRWDLLRDQIKQHGLRNSLLIAIAPTATIASIVGSYECIEPQVSNLFKRETLSGDFIQINRYLVQELQQLGLWNENIRTKIKMGEGSIQDVHEIPQKVRDVYRTVWEVPQKSLIEMAALRGPFIDQSQSLNLFIESPTIGKLSSMYLHAWKTGLKTTYYLRSRPATKINKTTVGMTTTAAPAQAAELVPSAPAEHKKEYSDAEAIACSLENPEACEACT
jgi:ribonucleoside-diphosphate reductase alpha chain